jgi:hypothetical protein
MQKQPIKTQNVAQVSHFGTRIINKIHIRDAIQNTYSENACYCSAQNLVISQSPT